MALLAAYVPQGAQPACIPWTRSAIVGFEQRQRGRYRLCSRRRRRVDVAQPDVFDRRLPFDQADALAIAASAENREVGRPVPFVFVKADFHPARLNSGQTEGLYPRTTGSPSGGGESRNRVAVPARRRLLRNGVLGT